MKRLLIALLLLFTTPAVAQQCLPHPSNPAGTATVQASTTGTTATIAATLPAAVGKYTYVCGFIITSAGATTATTRTATLSGMGTTLSFAYLDPITAAGQGRLVMPFPTCIPASAPNTAIVLTLPGTGTGTVIASVVLWGCQQ